MIPPVDSTRSDSTSGRLSVFLSHSMNDREHVALVKAQMEALGVDVYLAEHDSHPGFSIAGRVESALRNSDVVVVLLTANSVDSAYVQQEVGLARALGKTIVPVADVSVDESRLGMLMEVERLVIDLNRPLESVALVTRSLQPFIEKQIKTTVLSGQVGAPSRPGVTITVDFDMLMVFGLGLLLGILIVNMTREGLSA